MVSLDIRKENLEYTRWERDRAEREALELGQQLLEAKAAQRQQSIEWGWDYSELCDKYDRVLAALTGIVGQEQATAIADGEPKYCPHGEHPVFCNECRGIYDE